MSDPDLPPELSAETESVEYLARAKRRVAEGFGWNREKTLESGSELALALLVFRRDDEALRVAEFFAKRPFTGHDLWYATEHVLALASRLQRKADNLAAARAHTSRILASDDWQGRKVARFVDTRLDGSLMIRKREHITRYVEDGNVSEENAWRAFLAWELITVIEVCLTRGRDVSALEQELRDTLRRMREIRNV